jgi:hypothetical protein
VVGGDPRFLLLKDSMTTAVVGLAILLTTLLGRPLTYAAMQSFNPAKATYLEQRYEADPQVRHGYRLTSMVWASACCLRPSCACH